VERRGLKATGETIGQKRVDCPRKVAFKESTGDVAAVVLRDVEIGANIGLRPTFALPQGGVHLIEIRQGKAVIGRIGVQGRVAKWPAAAPPLIDGARYQVSLLEADRRLTSTVLAKAGAGVTIVQP